MDNDLFFNLLVQPFFHGIVCWLLAYVLAPSQFLKVVHQETKQPYIIILKKYLVGKNYKKFFSGVHVYALRQLISALSFGFAQGVYLYSLSCFPIMCKVCLIHWQCFLIAGIETLVTIHSELKEIVANKGKLMKREGTIGDIITPVFLRNFLVGSTSIVAHEWTKYVQGGVWTNMVICTLCAIVLSVLAMPFDCMATQSCGAAVRMTWFYRLKQYIIVEKQWLAIFNGTFMRILQIVVYSLARSLVMICLQ